MKPRLIVLIALALACGGGDLVLPNDVGRATTLTIAAGDEQTGAVGGPLDDPLVVRVTDGTGQPVAGVAVEWSASAGSVDPASTLTDEDGRASTRRILGDDLGAQSATASSSGLAGSPVGFRHVAIAGDAARLVKVAGDDQTARVGTLLPTTLVVRLLDDADNPVAGQAVTWLVTGGAISPLSAATDANGRSSARWTLGETAGKQTVTAVVSGVGVVEFTATATTDGDGKGGKGGGKGGGGSGSIAPARVAIVRGNNQRALAGTAVEAAPAVVVTDDAGDAVAGVAVSFAVIEGGGSVSGASVTSDASGIAAVGRWVLGPRAGTNRLRATVQASGVAGNPVTFTTTATAPVEPDRLVFRVSPSRTEEDERIEPAVQVAVMHGGTISSSRQGVVRLELIGGDRRADLRGATERDLVRGVATFANLRVDREGRGYRLRASVDGLAPIESDAFDVIDH